MSDQPNDAKRTKVLWLTSSYPRNEDDSASIFLRYLAEALVKQDIDLLVLAPDHSEVQPFRQPSGLVCRHFRYFFPRRLQQLAYGSGILPNLRAAPWLYLQVPFFILSMLVAAGWILRSQRPSLIHAHWIFPQGTVAVVLGKLFRIPAIVTAHGSDVFLLKGRFLGVIKRWTVKNCTVWTSNSWATSGAIGADGLLSPHIIPMGINYRHFALDNRKLSVKQTKLILLFVGRLVETKGVAILLKAYALLSDALLDATELWIIGDGKEIERLKALAYECRIQDKVIFFGRLPNNQLPKYYAAADIFVSPSMIEGQGVTFLEALANGVPIICSDVGGVAEIIKHGETGLLVRPNNVDELFEAIYRLITNRELRMKLSKAGKKIARCYDWEYIAKQFLSLYINHLNSAEFRL
ncbi:glycosyltransferase [Methylomonas koyamae]|uniref:glycosyltransferase n=1 Tax=Methylomonas koyamae TaxID=702114 RepID=UPI002872EECE|nr:glycosyltransferase [Methylomonas koyamae]WNB74225.1 glycosyltransferase [Methylomonas koyamae]